MRVSGDQQERGKQPDPIEFVPKQELDRAEQQIKKQQREIERLQQENGRLRKELEAALRASKRQAAPHSRGKPKTKPKRPGRKPGRNYGKQSWNHLNDSGRSWGSPGGTELEVFRPLLNDTCQ